MTIKLWSIDIEMDFIICIKVLLLNLMQDVNYTENA